MQDMNYAHNRNKYAPTPERTVEQVRLADLMRAVDNANHSATNELNTPAEITVTEVPVATQVSAVPNVYSTNVIEIESRRRVEAAYAPTSEQPTQPIEQQPLAQVVQFPVRPIQPNTLPIDEMYRRAAGL